MVSTKGTITVKAAAAMAATTSNTENVTTEKSSLIVSVAAKQISVNMYPNLFRNTFMVNMETESDEAVTIIVMDLIGRIIEEHVLDAFQYSKQEIGKGCSEGIYNVIITQGNFTKTLRAVKN